MRIHSLAALPFFSFLLAWLQGCATVPFFRPMGPPLGDKVMEVGIGPHAELGKDTMGVGTGAWMHVQVAPDVELVLRGHGTDFFAYRGGAKLFGDVLTGGSVGVRGRYRWNEDLLLGGEALVDYQLRTGSGSQLISGIVGIPVAEQAFKGFWVYTNISVGLAIPLHDNPEAPFFGFQEVPLGVVWEAAPWCLLVAEGGYALPLDGGYGGVAAAFRF